MVSMAYDSLRGFILAGTLKPGQPLSQVQLARQLGVSRGPLREAIRMLPGVGLVDDASQPSRPRHSLFH